MITNEQISHFSQTVEEITRTIPDANKISDKAPEAARTPYTLGSPQYVVSKGVSYLSLPMIPIVRVRQYALDLSWTPDLGPLAKV